MSEVIKFSKPFRVRGVDAETLETLGQLSEALRGFSLRQSWEDEDCNRYFPLSPWLSDEDTALVIVRDGGNGQFRELLLMTRAHAWLAGMPMPKVIQIENGGDEDV